MKKVRKKETRQAKAKRLSRFMDPLGNGSDEKVADPRVADAWREYFQRANDKPARDLGLLP